MAAKRQQLLLLLLLLQLLVLPLLLLRLLCCQFLHPPLLQWHLRHLHCQRPPPPPPPPPCLPPPLFLFIQVVLRLQWLQKKPSARVPNHLVAGLVAFVSDM